MDERVLLDPRTSRDDIDDAMVRHDWQLVDIVSPTEARPEQLVYAMSDGRSWLRLVDDARLGVAYVQATGPDSAAALAQVREALVTITPDRLWQQLKAQEPDARCQGLCWLAATGMSAPDASAVACVREALCADDPAVREAALMATSYLGWAELEQVLGERAEAEPVASLRRVVRALLDAWRARSSKPEPGVPGSAPKGPDS